MEEILGDNRSLGIYCIHGQRASHGNEGQFEFDLVSWDDAVVGKRNRNGAASQILMVLAAGVYAPQAPLQGDLPLLARGKM